MAKLRMISENDEQRLYHQIKAIARSSMLDKLMTFGLDCVQTLAAYQKQESQRVGLQTWEAIGFKYLSFQGYDVDGLRVIDYGSS